MKARPALLTCADSSLRIPVLKIMAQLVYPKTYFGGLSVVPRIGFRGTYYGDTRDLGNTIFTPNPNPLVPDFLLPNPTLAHPIDFGGDTFRTVFNTGAEASFKFSRTWENV